MTEIAVAHLVWVPAGLEPLGRFLTSYERNPGGLAHDLIVIFNGHATPEQLRPLQARVADVPHKPFVVDHPGQDLASYRLMAQAHSYRYVCFLNSYTQLLDPQWLSKMQALIMQPGIGVVGATGSWETTVPPLAGEYARLSKRNLPGRVRGHLRLAWQRFRYPAFPNPHIRTNGFLIARDLALQLQGMSPRNKREAWRFENGHNSMTRQIQARGLRPLVVGRNGAGYEIAEWPRSNTFRQGDQGNLLLSDNRTDDFARSTLDAQRAFYEAAWQGQGLPPVPGRE